MINGAEPGVDTDSIHKGYLRRHVLLYADLRRGLSDLWLELGKGLTWVAKKSGLSIAPVGQSGYCEEWVRAQISRLAKVTENGERMWYISWVLDNTDQMSEAEHLDLLRLLFEWIPEAPTGIVPSDPVIDGQHRKLWRIIIPIRPETIKALEPDWSPLRNRDQLLLDPIDHDVLVGKRAEFLFQVISASTKGSFIDLWEQSVDQEDIATQQRSGRAYYDASVPGEKAPQLSKGLLAAHDGKSDIADGTGVPEDAWPTFDKLVHDSARRRLYLVGRVFSSNVFHERRRLRKLSAFYFFEALLRGNKTVFTDDLENLILNLYALGPKTKGGNAYSIFVGIYSIYFLSQGREWDDVCFDLARIGYTKRHLRACQASLKGKEVLKEVAGQWSVETPIAEGHWDLLQQRAYTDNMTVACAIEWGAFKRAVATDPLKPESLLARLDCSVWFLGKIWEAEKALSGYPSKDRSFRKRCGDFTAFAKARKELNLPTVTMLVASSYLERVKKLPGWIRPRRELVKDQTEWQRIRLELCRIVNESSQIGALRPYQR